MDRVFAAIETIVTPVSLLDGKNKDEKRRRKKREMFVIATAVVLLIALLFTSLFQTKKTADIRIASMDFTENEIFAYMLSESIERELGLDVETTPDLGAGSVCMSSIQSNEIDGYVDYTGTLYVNILKNPASSDVEQVYQDSVKGMKEQYGLEVLNSLNVNNTYTLSTTKELAEQYSLKTISDMKSLPQPVTICSTLAFMNREDGLLGVEDRYGFQFDKKGVDGSRPLHSSDERGRTGNRRVFHRRTVEEIRSGSAGGRCGRISALLCSSCFPGRNHGEISGNQGDYRAAGFCAVHRRYGGTELPGGRGGTKASGCGP